MARIISAIPVQQMANRGERQAMEALERHLEPHFLVLPNVHFLRRHGGAGNLVDGEADIVILDQRQGVLLVLEVKEGRISVGHSGDGREVWVQSDHQMDTSPWVQVKGNMYELIDYVKRHFGWSDFPLSYGYALLLPDVHTPIRWVAPNISSDVALTWESPEDLAKRVSELSSSWFMAGKRSPTEVEIDLVRQALMPEFVYGDTLRDRIGAARARNLQGGGRPGAVAGVCRQPPARVCRRVRGVRQDLPGGSQGAPAGGTGGRANPSAGL